MNNLQIFQNTELEQINEVSDKIVSTLSDNYQSIIQKMVGKSATTKATYKRNVEHFLAFIQMEGINAQSYGLYRKVLEDVEQISPKTKNAYLSATKALLRESLKYGILPIDITANVPQFKIATGHTRDGLTEDEVNKVLSYIYTIKRQTTRFKMLAMFHLFAGEGLRQFEAQNIKVSDIKADDKMIMIKGKGQDDKQPVLVLQSTIDALKKHLSTSSIKDGFIFPSRRKDKPITLRAIRKYWTDGKYGIFSKAGISSDRSTHGFRHFFATKTLEIFGGDLHKAKNRTRHKTAATLQIYDDRRLAKKDIEELEQAFTFSPTFKQSEIIGMGTNEAIQHLRSKGTSFSKIATQLNMDGFTTASDGKFYASTVQRLFEK